MKIDKLKNIRCRFLAVAIILTIGVAVKAEAFRIADDTDTTKVMTLVRENFNPGGDPASIAGKVAESLIGAKREEVTMNDSVSTLLIRTDAFDDMGFLNMVTAISRLATSPGHKRMNEFAKELENVTFRRGEEKGFPSRMIYFSDWVVDNKARNNVKELTEYYSDQFRTKSLEKVTRNREKYAALKDSATYEDQKMVEMGFRTHKVPHLKREQAAHKEILSEMRDGDIVVLLTSDPQTDALDIGFVRKRDDGFHLIHPSVDSATIVEESETLDRYLKRIVKRTYGWRWLRLQK